MADPRQQIVGTITVDGQRKALTTYDYEWALKATLGEASGDVRNAWEWGAVLWTMLHRWTGNYGHSGESFGDYIQRFSQPVNPSQIGKVHDYDRTEQDPSGLILSGERDVRIRANRARSVAEIERRFPELATYVRKFLQGAVPRLPYILFANFAAPKVRSRLEEVGRGKGNVFYAEPWVYRLDIRFSRTTVAIAAGLTLLAIGAGVGYYFWLKAHAVE